MAKFIKFWAMKLPAYAKYIFEVLAIFVGITLSFMVDEWREDKQNREETLTALGIIKEDLQQDSINIKYNIFITEFLSSNYQYQFANNQRLENFDSIMNFQRCSHWNQPLILHESGIDNLRNLNNVIFTNKNLHAALSNYYAKGTDDYEKHLQELIFQNTLNLRNIDSPWRKSLFTDKRTKTEIFTPMSYTWSLRDSSFLNINHINTFFYELKEHMTSEYYFNLLSNKLEIEKYRLFYAEKKLRECTNLLQLVEVELKK